MAGNLLADSRPIEFSAAGYINLEAAIFLQEVNGVLRQQSAIPLGPLIGAVGAAFGREFCRGIIGTDGYRLHDFVVKLDGFLRSKRDVATVEAILQAHHAHTDWTVTQVGRASRFSWVEVDVDNVIERAHRHENGLTEFRMIDAAFIIQVLVEND